MAEDINIQDPKKRVIPPPEEVLGAQEKTVPSPQSVLGDIKKKDEVPLIDSSPQPSPLDSNDRELDPVGAAILSGDPYSEPILKSMATKSPWLAAPINHLVGLTRGTSGTFAPILDGAQKMFYKGVGSLMELSPNPSISTKGTELKIEQETTKSWWKKAGEAVDKFAEEKMPAPDIQLIRLSHLTR